MIYTNDGYIVGITMDERHNNPQTFLAYENKPAPPDSYDYLLRADTLEWELVEVPPIVEEQGYTAEQLSAMTNAELSAIIADMGIGETMTKANMISLILGKQFEA